MIHKDENGLERYDNFISIIFDLKQSLNDV
jgi:hypothetical protein